LTKLSLLATQANSQAFIGDHHDKQSMSKSTIRYQEPMEEEMRGYSSLAAFLLRL
jgi:hypothetical protein